MRVGIIQSNFIPWRGYFDFINSVDLFIFHDDLQYTKGDWRNRNKIKTRTGLQWLTVPVKYKHTGQRICDTEIDYSVKWVGKHYNLLTESYSKSPDFADMMGLFETGHKTISELNIALIRKICGYLGICTKLSLSIDYNVTGAKTDRLVQLLDKAGATVYLSGPSADCYLDKKALFDAGISLEYKSYDYKPYPQLYGDFMGKVSVLDMIANGYKDFTSQSPNKVII